MWLPDRGGMDALYGVAPAARGCWIEGWRRLFLVELREAA